MGNYVLDGTTLEVQHRPYALTTLWDMLRFNAHSYVSTLNRIGELYGSVRAFRDVGHTGTPIPEHIRL